MLEEKKVLEENKKEQTEPKTGIFANAPVNNTWKPYVSGNADLKNIIVFNWAITLLGMVCSREGFTDVPEGASSNPTQANSFSVVCSFRKSWFWNCIQYLYSNNGHSIVISFVK